MFLKQRIHCLSKTIVKMIPIASSEITVNFL